MFGFRSLRLAAFIGLLSFVPVHAHEGHVHGDEAPPPSVQTAPRATAISEVFELVAVADGPQLTVYLDRFDTNAPVTGATIDAETPAGPVALVPDGDIYRLDAPWTDAPGSYELLFTVATDAEIDFLTGTLTIPEPAVAATPAPAPLATKVMGRVQTGVASAQDRIRRADPALIGIGVLGFLGGILVMALMRRRFVAASTVATVIALVLGTTAALADTAPVPVIRDVAQRLPDGRVFAPKAAQRILAIRTMAAIEDAHRRSVEMPGRVIPDPNASGFVQTALGGRLMAPPGGFPVLGSAVQPGDLMALVEPSVGPADQSAIRQTKTELDQEIALEDRRVTRLRALSQTGNVSASQLEEAELTLAGLRERRASIDTLRLEPEALRAPVTGIVSKANAFPGLIAETNTEVFHIIDPARLWVEALSFGGDPVAETATTRSADGRVISLGFIGAGFAEEGQAQPIHFRIDGDAEALAVGARVTVFAQTRSVINGIAAPREAIIRGNNGEDIVFVHVAPELFEPRSVRTEPLDGGRVIVVAGLSAGDRMVTTGAELLNQLR
ncbi:HlyD family efflux transporter periplasmic adaptor subunit [Tabrizicola sp. WMC-M-20]|nr:HlyD family efflux transporter periplasmic adaptor subunit [Tabrizicola sp. WMC-M-20]